MIADLPCEMHEPDPDDALGYIEWIRMARERSKAGQKQRQCTACGLFIWERLYITESLDR